jgi:TATA-box binding protein (TBP) (component of TFIID and TFIIIB)
VQPATKKIKLEEDEKTPLTVIPQKSYKSDEFIQRVLAQTSLRINNVVLGAKCSATFKRADLIGRQHGFGNRRLLAATTFSVGVRTGLSREQEKLMMEGADHTKNASINVFNNGGLLLTGTPNLESGVETVYAFLDILNDMFYPKVVEVRITVKNIKPHNLHVTMNLMNPLNIPMIRNEIQSVYRPDLIHNLRIKDPYLKISSLSYASGQIVLIGRGDIASMWNAACIVAERLAQFCA